MADWMRLRAVALGDKDLRVLRSLLSLVPESATVRWRVESDIDEADAVLVDVDDARGGELWNEIAAAEPLAVALTRRRDFPARLKLDKPLRSQQVLRMMGWLAEPGSIPEEPQPWPVITFGKEDDPLPLGEHLRRHSWDEPIRLTGDGPPLIIDPGSGVWYFSGSEREIARLLALRFRRSEPEAIPSHELVDQIGDLEQQNLANLKWRAGLALSDGAMHPDLAGAVRFMLPQVPLQALSDTAYSRQSRILIKQPVTVDELVEASGAERADVAQFLNACHACGYLLLDRRDSSRQAL